ncbi:MAG: SelT/SelW/SelH family protein [Deltaproteobacteria bacterium]|nr:SelT/SelW/SelH family protein [Deltaproteobacteria bacterium]MBI3390952.1 SelT/SelW/SelH family protein [Deltaproteobacteria bacterium]
MPRATSLAASLKQRFAVETELIRGKDGVFDVRVGDQLVFSKHQVHRFPEPGEVEQAIEQLRSRSA